MCALTVAEFRSLHLNGLDSQCCGFSAVHSDELRSPVCGMWASAHLIEGCLTACAQTFIACEKAPPCLCGTGQNWRRVRSLGQRPVQQMAMQLTRQATCSGPPFLELQFEGEDFG
ncbi:unnamed protein product [Effrenium voratum]|nr:unnamed protein product [Effrenium voratum]